MLAILLLPLLVHFYTDFEVNQYLFNVIREECLKIKEMMNTNPNKVTIDYESKLTYVTAKL